MKKISEAVNKLSPEIMTAVAAILGMKKGTEKTVTTRIQTISALVLIFDSLNPEELLLAGAVYKRPDGVTFTELEKELGINSLKIEQLAENLSNKILVYILKNRQLLNNKLDKIYPIQELAAFINPADNSEIIENLKNIREYLLNPDSVPKVKKISIDEKKATVIRYIAEHGFMADFKELQENFQSTDTLLTALKEEGYIHLYYKFDKVFNIYATINHEKLNIVSTLLPVKSNVTVNNGYTAVNNMLSAFDIISAFGLFLTQQNEFRKIDLRRIVDSMIPVFDCYGDSIDIEVSAAVSLSALRINKCVSIYRDAVSASLSPIKKEFDSPGKIISKTLKKIENARSFDPNFAFPLNIPSSKYFEAIVSLLHSYENVSYAVLDSAIFLGLILDSPENLRSFAGKNADILNDIKSAATILCLFGVIAVSNGEIYLTGASPDYHTQLTGDRKHQNKNLTQNKNIYINPDFSIIIPSAEVDPISLYYLLAYIEIEKYDVILHARITKSSIIRAHKRGMPVDKFLETLKDSSKSDLPQNMDFLLNEWINQIVEIDISHQIVLKASHPGFLDELSYSKAGVGIIERITDHFVIVDNEHLEEIIKFSRKKDVTITLFNQERDKD